jgi:hypothetical protein
MAGHWHRAVCLPTGLSRQRLYAAQVITASCRHPLRGGCNIEPKPPLAAQRQAQNKPILLAVTLAPKRSVFKRALHPCYAL